VHFDNPDDAASAVDGTFLLGRGSKWDDRRLSMSTDVLFEKVESELLGQNVLACNGWMSEMVHDDAVSVFVHDRAMFQGQEVLTSRLYKHEKARDSCHISATYVGENGAQEHIGVIKSFVRLEHNDPNVDAVPLRFALVDFYAYKPPIVDYDLGTVHRVDIQEFEEGGHNYPVLFSAINHKLVYCTSANDRYLVKYNIASGLF
jgi:hypothetical protein